MWSYCGYCDITIYLEVVCSKKKKRIWEQIWIREQWFFSLCSVKSSRFPLRAEVHLPPHDDLSRQVLNMPTLSTSLTHSLPLPLFLSHLPRKQYLLFWTRRHGNNRRPRIGAVFYIWMSIFTVFNLLKRVLIAQRGLLSNPTDSLINSGRGFMKRMRERWVGGREDRGVRAESRGFSTKADETICFL